MGTVKQKEDYYNAVYADHELDLDPEQLYSVSMREDAERERES